MVVTAEQLAEIALWLEQFSAASQQLKEDAADAARMAWLSFDDWYDAVLVAGLAAEMAELSLAAQQVSSGLSSQYIAAVAAAAGIAGAPAPRVPWQAIRNGANMLLVHHRPAEAYRRAIATGHTHQEALALAGLRAAGLILTDLSLEDRAAQQAMLGHLGIVRFRRVIRPELSRTGTCGLCIVAADRIYNTGDLMPIHPPSCNCVVMPIVADNDPGGLLNSEDLARVYADAGSNRAKDLARTRYTVNQHGEFGPVLTKLGDTFRGPDKVALEDDPERAARLLTKVAPVLTLMETEGAERGPLNYQRELFERLSRIVGTQSSAA